MHGIRYEDVGEGVARVFESFLTLRRQQLSVGKIDAVSDLQHLPAAAHKAKKRLFSMSADPPGIGITLDLTDDDQLSLVRDFGPYSISATVWGENRSAPILSADDSGALVIVEGDPDWLKVLARSASVPVSAFRPVPSWEEPWDEP